MNKQNLNERQEEIEKRYEKRRNKKRKKMKVSGAKVKELRRIIGENRG